MSNSITICTLLALTLMTGCVKRTISIDSEPQGALVYLNDIEIGRTPTRVPFTFYGVYSVRLEKEGFTTLNTSQKAVAPWWDTLGPDLFSELSPEQKHVKLDWKFELEPQKTVSEADLLDHAKQMRTKTLRDRVQRSN